MKAVPRPPPHPLTEYVLPNVGGFRTLQADARLAAPGGTMPAMNGLVIVLLVLDLLGLVIGAASRPQPSADTSVVAAGIGTRPLHVRIEVPIPRAQAESPIGTELHFAPLPSVR